MFGLQIGGNPHILNACFHAHITSPKCFCVFYLKNFTKKRNIEKKPLKHKPQTQGTFHKKNNISPTPAKNMFPHNHTT